ncbi:MAG: ZIP family metal transporter [Candidatus Bathyarchaeota archaeon]|nr:MAG: ZIP family metal transporter [Candidatus Bathyarchaeota archaeon]
MKYILYPVLLSLIAGSASGLGGLIVLLFGKVEDWLMGFLMGFAGGVMLIVSFLELFTEALNLLTHIEATIAFATGALLMMAIDLTLPHMEVGRWERGVANPEFLKSGLIIALGISLHNFPEGLVISASYSHLPTLGLMMALMICLHNVPEGIATATPLALAGVSKRRAATMAFLSGMTEPIGALVGSFIISGLGSGDYIIGLGLALAAGIMTYITVDELIPMAHEYGNRSSKHYISTGILMGLLLGHIVSVILKIG